MRYGWGSLIACGVCVGVGCVPEIGAPSDPGVEQVSGRLTIKADPPMGTDVVAIKVKVVPSGSACTAAALQEKVGVIRPDVTLGANPVTDVFFVLAPGDFRVCATPLKAVMGLVPSDLCHPADAVAMVMPEMTTEIVLVSQCKGTPTGGLDVLAALNRPPMITDLTLSPSKLVLPGHDVDIAVTATDPDFDFLSFEFTLVSGPAGATLTASGSHATFRATMGGDYEVRVVVTDGQGGRTTLTFPIHVAL